MEEEFYNPLYAVIPPRHDPQILRMVISPYQKIISKYLNIFQCAEESGCVIILSYRSQDPTCSITNFPKSHLDPVRKDIPQLFVAEAGPFKKIPQMGDRTRKRIDAYELEVDDGDAQYQKDNRR